MAVQTLAQDCIPTPAGAGCADAHGFDLDAARSAQRLWAALPLKERLGVVRKLRSSIAEASAPFAEEAVREGHPLEEVLSAEVLPLLEAAKFLERNAASLLKTRSLGRRGLPLWMGRLDARILREPHGVVAVIAPSNYPLFLPGVQSLQALTAGNAVIWKPAPGGGPIARKTLELARASGLPPNLLQITAETPQAGRALSKAAVDKLIFTGGAPAGAEVLASLAANCVPAVVELSGCDAVFVREDADLPLVARALRFGLQFNRSRTCIAPRRVFVHRSAAAELERLLLAELRDMPESAPESHTQAHLHTLLCDAESEGARFLTEKPDGEGAVHFPCVFTDAPAGLSIFSEDLFAPVLGIIPVNSDEEALAGSGKSPFALGASIFTRDPKAARELASRIRAGWVCVNDVIAPSADPRIPFGGFGRSGFGVTRGAEGLLEMTRLKVVQVRRGGPAAHLSTQKVVPGLLSALIQFLHGGSIGRRLAGLKTLTGFLVGKLNQKPVSTHESGPLSSPHLLGEPR